MSGRGDPAARGLSWLPKTTRGRLILGLVCAGLVLAVGLPVFAMGRMTMGTPTASEAQVTASAAGDQLEIALEVTAAPDGGPFAATVLERSDQGTYRRSSRALRVRWGSDTSLVMGRVNDIRPGAIVQARGRMGIDDLLEADRLVILTGSVVVR
jgi:hypothetical protein